MKKGNDIMIFVNSGTFKDGDFPTSGTHYMRLKNFKDQGTTYSMEYWDYGGWTEKTMTHRHFWRSVFGIISIKP